MIRHDPPIVFLPDSLFPHCIFRVSLLSPLLLCESVFMTRSEFGYFCAGMAAGAAGHAAFPQLKEKFSPYLAGAAVFAQQAFGDAMKSAMETVESMQRAGEPVGGEFFAAKPVAEPSSAASATARGAA